MSLHYIMFFFYIYGGDDIFHHVSSTICHLFPHSFHRIINQSINQPIIESLNQSRNIPLSSPYCWQTLAPFGRFLAQKWSITMWCLHGSLYYQPKQCMVIREISQNYHQFLLFDSFDSLKMGSLMSLFFNQYHQVAAKVQIPMPFVPSTAAVLRQSFPLWAPWHAPQRRAQHVEKHDHRWWRSVPKKESLSDGPMVIPHLCSGWWFQPIGKILVKLEIFPK